MTDITLRVLMHRLAAAAKAEDAALARGLRDCAKTIAAGVKDELEQVQAKAGAASGGATDVPAAAKGGSAALSGAALAGRQTEQQSAADLRRSVGFTAEGMHASIGSTSDRVAELEFGTHRTAPHAVLGAVFAANRDKIEAMLGEAAVKGITGR